MRDRVRDYALLLAASAILTLPNLGVTSLWDMDEGVNAQAAREMRDSDTWVIPTFNYELRTAKPVMLYWLQRASYAAFGVSEWSARLPSVLAGWLTVLLVYELARRMFDRSTGLLAGLILASAAQFAVLSHAATPDATLLLFTVLTYLLFWRGHQNGSRSWWVPTAAACGLAMLTKGPVGVALPGLVIFLYFAWNRELGRLLDRKFLLAALVWVLVAAPWYGLVAAETRGEWVKAFLGNENVNRFLSTMERHGGGWWFYPAVILAMFAPWSAFLLAGVWYGVKGTRREPNPPTPFPEKEGGGCSPSPLGGGDRGEGSSDELRAHRFLVCWAAAYVVFFTAAATKLPNYVYPVYPALAVLTARFLVRWRDGSLAVPRWLMPAGAVGLLLTGAAVAGGMLYGEQTFPGLGAWAALGVVPAAGGAAVAWHLRRGHRGGAIVAASVAAVAFMAVASAFPPNVVEQYKAPRELVRASGVADPQRDLRLAAFDWFQPSVVFYSGREVDRLASEEEVAEFLIVPTPAYLFVPAKAWAGLSATLPAAYRVVGKRHDFLRGCDVLVVTNVPADR
jgi:4-amino-4-deoxy-L-arabinose transferase-like glycosyltransferase